VSKRDYYEILGVMKTQAMLRSRAPIGSSRSSITPTRTPATTPRGQVQGMFRGVRRPGRSREACLYDRYGHAGVTSAAGAGSIRTSSTLRRHSRQPRRHLSDSATCLAAGAARRSTARRAPALHLEITFEESARAETTILIPRQESCETCHGTGAAAGSTPTTCPQCRGQGPASDAAGFFTVARTCPPSARGAARTRHYQAVRGPATAPAASRASARSRSRFRQGSPRDSSSACRAKAKADRPAARPAICCRGSSPGTRLLPPRRRDLFWRDSSELRGWRSAAKSTCGRSTASSTSKCPRHADGNDPSPERQRPARRLGSRQRRSFATVAGADAEEADARTARAARSAREGAAR